MKVKKNLSAMLKKDFVSFVHKTFAELNPSEEYLHNWHVEEICKNLIDIYTGKKTRLIICMPPRYLKSICVSIAFPAWMLGRNPCIRIIASSYSAKIAYKLSIDCKNIIQTKWYKTLFPRTIIIKGQNEKNKFVTSMNGFRMAVSSLGSITGEGGDILIADDPQKPITINSKLQREKVIEWFEGTFATRLNNKKTGAIIIVMQRLHENDLVGFLLSRKKTWHSLTLKAIATADERFRKAGEALHKTKEDIEDLDKIKEDIGERAFETQYQQNPQSANSSMLERKSICITQYHNNIEDMYVISVDTASKANANSDFTAITIWACNKNEATLIECLQLKLEFYSILSVIKQKAHEVNARYILIEDKSSGIGIVQELQRLRHLNIVPIKPFVEKSLRFASAIPYIEKHFIKFSEKMNNLADVVEQITAFPKTKNDDIVDSISQFINWKEDFFGKFSDALKPPIIKAS